MLQIIRFTVPHSIIFTFKSMQMTIHPLADVQSQSIGAGTQIWQFSVVLKGAAIGENCNLNCHTFVENDVVIGSNVTLKAGVFLWDGITVEDNVFIGPNATFINDKFPRSKQYPERNLRTTLRFQCSIGANATIQGGITIGRYAIVGAGAVVTKDVPDYALVIGSPARVAGWVDEHGNKLQELPDGSYVNTEGDRFLLNDDRLERLKS